MRICLPVVVMMVLAGCSDTGGFIAPDLPDAGDDGTDLPVDASFDARPDADPDAPLPDLTAICGENPTTPEAWEACYLKRKCEWKLNCDAFQRFHDVAECIAEYDAFESGWISHELRERLRALDAERAALDLHSFAQCLIDTDARACQTALYSAACADRYLGTVPDGGECYSDVECADQGFPERVYGRSDGTACVRTCKDACCAGVCQRARRVGETCSATQRCETGHPCSGVDEDGDGQIEFRCMSGEIGAACRGGHECLDENACLDGKCAPKLAEGAECFTNLECPDDQLCIVETRGERPRCRRADKVGDACNNYCLGNLYCQVSTNSGKCVALPGVDEVCDSAFRRCDGVDLICLTGVCTPTVGIGASCAGAFCEFGTICGNEVGLEATCIPMQPAGEPCQFNRHCASHICGADLKCQPWLDTCPSTEAQALE